MHWVVTEIQDMNRGLSARVKVISFCRRRYHNNNKFYNQRTSNIFMFSTEAWLDAIKARKIVNSFVGSGIFHLLWSK